MKKIIFLTMIALSMSVISCGGAGSSGQATNDLSDASETTDGTAEGQSGGSTESASAGQTGNSETVIEDGVYSFPTADGVLGSSGTSPVVAEENPDGSWSLADGVTVIVKDGDGNIIEGSVSVDSSGTLVFIPDDINSPAPGYLIVQTGSGTYTYEIDGNDLSSPTYVPASPSGGNSTGGGIGSSEGTAVLVENGTVIVTVDENGQILIQGNGIDVNDQSEVNIVVTDSDGNVLDGTVVKDSEGNYVFYPDPTTPLVSGESYDVTVVIDGTEYSAETIMVSVDDTSVENSKFASAGGFSAGTFSMNDLLNDLGQAVFGWDFDDAYSFKFTMQNVPSGAAVYITAYGVYDIEGHENEVYYQRWSSTNEPVKDFNITGYTTITINPEDTAIELSDGSYCDFAKTYVEILIVDSEGNDITASCGAGLLIQ